MSVEECEGNIKDVLQKVLRKLQIRNYKIGFTRGSLTGDGYLSIIYRAEVVGENMNEETVSQNFIIKVALREEFARKVTHSEEAFRAEIHFYKNVFPTLLMFQKTKSIQRPFECVPRCYASNLKEFQETIIFEDLKSSSFIMWNRKLPMPEDYIVAVLREYGRYHALSYSLREQQPEVFKELTDNMVDVLKSLVDSWDQEVCDGIIAAAKRPIPLIQEEGGNEAVEKYHAAVNDYVNILSTFARKEDRQSVILHGDNWCSNMMFKSAKDSAPTEVRFLDFQLQRLGSPVLDILYFFFASATGEILENFDKYMEIYYDSLSSFTKELGSDLQKLFTMEDFKRHITTYGKYGLLFAIMVMRVMFLETDEVPNLSGEEDLKSFSEEIKEQRKVCMRVKDVVLLAIRKNII